MSEWEITFNVNEPEYLASVVVSGNKLKWESPKKVRVDGVGILFDESIDEIMSVEDGGPKNSSADTTEGASS